MQICLIERDCAYNERYGRKQLQRECHQFLSMSCERMELACQLQDNDLLWEERTIEERIALQFGT